MDKQPTEAQIKEFWEWCGFYQDPDRASDMVWVYPDGGERIPPPIDLNNLFKYAVPKTIKIIMAKHQYSEYGAYLTLLSIWLDSRRNIDSTVSDFNALALFWAIYPFLKVKNDTG